MMSKYEIFMKMLKDKGCVKAMQMAKNLTPEVPGINPELQKAIDKGCIAKAVTGSMMRDPELKKAFDQAATEMMYDKIVADLDLKKDENFKPTEQDLLAKSVAEVIVGMMFR
jgi:hypothetical protein